MEIVVPTIVRPANRTRTARPRHTDIIATLDDLATTLIDRPRHTDTIEMSLASAADAATAMITAHMVKHLPPSAKRRHPDKSTQRSEIIVTEVTTTVALTITTAEQAGNHATLAERTTTATIQMRPRVMESWVSHLEAPYLTREMGDTTRAPISIYQRMRMARMLR